jgi:hypothetical protein
VGDDAEMAARELFEVVRDLFPERFHELEAIADALDDFAWRDSDIGDYYDAMHFPPFRDRVLAWTHANRIACPSVNEVAGQIAAGEGIVRRMGRPLDSIGLIDGGVEQVRHNFRRAAVRPRPFVETRTQFLKRASDLFDEVSRTLEGRGFKRRPHKVQIHHFEWLAAHLVGDIPLVEFTRKPPTLNGRLLRRGSESAVSEGVHRAASLIGLALRKKPGPRPGSRAPRRRERRP